MSRKVIIYKRKKQGKTDYSQRLNLLKSGKLRLVIRRFSNNILAQIIEYHPNGDKILITAHSNALKKLGWKHHKGNLSAAYLTGALCAKKAKENKIEEAVLDIGLQESIKGSAIFSALKGAVDAGLQIPHSKEIFPDETRIQGSSDEIKKNFEEVKGKLI